MQKTLTAFAAAGALALGPIAVPSARSTSGLWQMAEDRIFATMVSISTRTQAYCSSRAVAAVAQTREIDTANTDAQR